ncbi:Periplasmic thiol:disulfide interchange protein DsbA [Labilithrix luteola]|uniref:Periplasmic thiol:disulfide interchange protein DsbA n=1 Tax=Labilithrix luteola TaxID=1391654 RepID=A0A0K1PQY8_9BACT|nr:thioredoxin domain-containing protein [Labilithrix luteola]AKU95786.1 Periplasmic thiol:disulfide interchange protein DsbA [Labilithrix luteola]
MAKDKDHKAHAADVRPPPDSGGMSTGVAVIGFLLCFLAGGAVMWGYDSHRMKTAGGITADSSSAGGAWADSDSPIPVTSKDPVWGSRSAPVTVVIFSDFQCPFCSRVEPTLDQVKKTYGPDKVRLVWKNQPLPFHDKAKPAAQAAQTVFTLKGSDAFWKFHDTAFQNQKDLSPESYEKWAVAAGVDANAYKTALASKKADAKIDEDQQLANKVGANGTPAFRINGVELSGAQPFEKFKEAIDKELGKAQAKIASGTPKDKIYVEMSKENFKAAPAKAEKEDDDEKEDTKTVWRVPVGNSPFQGKADAPVTIIEFSDFQCPYCKRVEPSLDKIKETYGDKVRIVWKHEPLPFHPRAKPAAALSIEARVQKGDKGFWEAHKRLFDSQPKLEDADLEKIAADMGLNVDKVKSAIKDEKYKKEIDADAELGEDVQASGTPHFFINGRRLVGAQPFEKFKTIIDEEVKKFDDAKGKVAAKDYYDSLMKTAKGAPEPEKKNAPPVPAGAPFKGGANAKVVIQEWSDFQCPFCSRVEPTIAEVMKTYGDKVKFVWRDKPLPMHPDAPLASEAAREALKQKGPDGFWKMHDKMFANQQKIKREDLEGYAKEIGLDMDKFKAALDSHVHKAVIDAEDKAGTDVGISGTPAFLINGYYISGAQPFPKFKKLIDRALNEAK